MSSSEPSRIFIQQALALIGAYSYIALYGAKPA
jgi:hypothetical protein